VKKIFSIFVISTVSIGLLSGCASLWPKAVEFGQKKIEKVPEPTKAHLEKEKEAADYLATKLREANITAVKENASSNLVYDIHGTSLVADSLSFSIGKPLYPYVGSPDILAAQLNRLEAKLDRKLDSFAERNNKMEGLKVEGSGWFSIGYFTYIGIFILIGFVLLTALKIYSFVNPAVGVGLNVAKIPINVMKRGFSEIVSAGEHFKENVDKKIEDPKTREMILELFRTSHQINQSSDIQNVIKNLTK
jgi:hypothetical protein